MGLGRETLVRLRTGCSPRCLPSPSPQLNVLLHRRPARGSPSLYLDLSRPTRDHGRGYATAPRSQALQRSLARPHKLPRLRGLPRTIEEVLEEGLDCSPSSKTITLTGHVHSIRRQKRSTFLSLSDGSSDRTIQVVLRHAPQLQKEVRDTLKEISFGSAIQITGNLVQSQGPGQDIDVLLDLHSSHSSAGIHILGTCDSTTYPLQPKNSTRLPSSSPTTQGHSLSHLRSHLHLRLRTPSLQHTLRLRALTKHILESYLSSPSRRFLSVHTPILTGIDAEGGGESFVVCAGDQGEGESFFNAPAYLTVSSQLHLEAFQASLGRVYTLSPCFRAERSLTARHLSEFWMLECEWALGGGGVEDLCEFVEDMVRYTIKEVVFPEHVGGESELYHTAFDPLPWPRITYTSAIKILQDQSLQHSLSLSQPQPLFQHPPTWGLPLQSEHEKYLTDVYFPPLQNQHRRLPVFVVDYPRSVKPFYMRVNDVEGIERANEAQTVACFDLLVPGVGELAGGSVREERYEILKQSMERAGLLSPSPSPSPPSSLSQSQSQSQPPNDTSSSSSSSSSDKIPSPYEWYLDLRKYGSIPHGGFGLGFERLIAWLVAGTEASGVASSGGGGSVDGSEENGGNVGEVGEVGNIREMIGMPRWKGRMAL